MTLPEAARILAELRGALYNEWNPEGQPAELRQELVSPAVEALDVVLAHLHTPRMVWAPREEAKE